MHHKALMRDRCWWEVEIILLELTERASSGLPPTVRCLEGSDRHCQQHDSTASAHCLLNVFSTNVNLQFNSTARVSIFSKIHVFFSKKLVNFAFHAHAEATLRDKNFLARTFFRRNVSTLVRLSAGTFRRPCYSVLIGPSIVI